MEDKFFSVEHEPALQGGEPPSADELEALRDSVANEPALGERAGESTWREWLEAKRARTGLAGNLTVTALAAILGGPAAVVGVFFAGSQGMGGALYAVLIAPLIEEVLKQSGMLYVLERLPHRIFTAWQFVVAGALSGFIFSAIENFMYIHLYGRGETAEALAGLAAFRWAVCTPLHVGCSLLASLGLVRVWRRRQVDGCPVDLSAGAPPFVAAVAIHAVYNFAAIFFDVLLEF